jgi:hypothetical protein
VSRPTAPLKRTRNAGYLQAKRRLLEKEQRAFDKQARKLVTWGRSR